MIRIVTGGEPEIDQWISERLQATLGAGELLDWIALEL
jgi:hypothetical protein